MFYHVSWCLIFKKNKWQLTALKMRCTLGRKPKAGTQKSFPKTIL